MAFLTAAGNEPVPVAVDEAVDTFLVQVERLVVLVLEVRDVVNVNETVQTRTDDVVQVRVELDFGDPTFVNLFLKHIDAVFVRLIGDGLSLGRTIGRILTSLSFLLLT